jgi:hypothetical protein
MMFTSDIQAARLFLVTASCPFCSVHNSRQLRLAAAYVSWIQAAVPDCVHPT